MQISNYYSNYILYTVYLLLAHSVFLMDPQEGTPSVSSLCRQKFGDDN
jgi:hypothetical protein